MAAAAHLRRLRDTLDGPIILGELSARLGREGVGLLVFICALPFLQPIPLAGLGTPIGFLLAAAGLQLTLGRTSAVLPRFIAEHRLEAASATRLLSAAERILGVAERAARPRWRAFAHLPKVYGVAIILLGMIFAIPIFVPLGNPATAIPLAMIGLALLEEDGLLGALGLVGTGATLIYHVACVRLMWSGIHAAFMKFT